jgi:predicted  nucleic acid-binding Zn-ribbon protein
LKGELREANDHIEGLSQVNRDLSDEQTRRAQRNADLSSQLAEANKHIADDGHSNAYRILVDAVPRAEFASMTGHAARIVVAELAEARAEVERWKVGYDALAEATKQANDRAGALDAANYLERRKIEQERDTLLSTCEAAAEKLKDVRESEYSNPEPWPEELQLRAAIEGVKNG